MPHSLPRKVIGISKASPDLGVNRENSSSKVIVPRVTSGFKHVRNVALRLTVTVVHRLPSLGVQSRPWIGWARIRQWVETMLERWVHVHFSTSARLLM